MVDNELARLIRETYANAARNRDTGAAFEQAVEVLARAAPWVSLAEARREVAMAIATEQGAF
jgi:hypothetical protein